MCLVAGGLLAWRVKQPAIGDYLKLSVDAAARNSALMKFCASAAWIPIRIITRAAGEYHRPGEPTNFCASAWGSRVNEIYDHEVPGALWKARYFRDSQPEEYVVVLRPDGSLHSVHHTLSGGCAGSFAE